MAYAEPNTLTLPHLDTAELVNHVGVEIIGNIGRIHTAIFRCHRQYHQEATRGLIDVDPMRCTISGSELMADCSLFWTWTCAVSGSVPFSKVKVICAAPLDDELEDIRHQSIKPFHFCSITCVTESSMVWAAALDKLLRY